MGGSDESWQGGMLAENARPEDHRELPRCKPAQLEEKLRRISGRRRDVEARVVRECRRQGATVELAAVADRHLEACGSVQRAWSSWAHGPSLGTGRAGAIGGNAYSRFGMPEYRSPWSTRQGGGERGATVRGIPRNQSVPTRMA